MSKVLYRLYRPQTFDELIGQNHITSLLKKAITNNKLSHAYLFIGPRGLGKTSMARILAKAINCQNPRKDGNPCNECDNCKSIVKGNFYDLIEIDAASNRGIEQIRALKEKIAYQPSQGKYKVYIIDEVHMLTKEAFNALLKTLEEPPSHVVFVLATTEGYKLPATILSRCQRYDFRLATKQDLGNLIDAVLKKEERKIDKEGIQLIISQAKGSFRDALSFLEVVLSGTEPDITVDGQYVRKILGLPDDTMVHYFLENLVNGKSRKSIKMLDEVYAKGVELSQFIYNVINVLKDSLISKTLAKKGNWGDSYKYHFLEKLSDKILLRTIKIFIEAEREIRNSFVPTLPIEVAVVEICQFLGEFEVGKLDKQESISKQKIGTNKYDQLHETKKKKTKFNVSQIKNTGDQDIRDKDSTEALKSCDINMEVKELKKKWNAIIEEVKKYNGHLYAFLRQANIISLKDGVLKLEVAFSFHKDRITSTQSKIAIQESFNMVLGFKPKVWCRVSKSKIQSTLGAWEEVRVNNVNDGRKNATKQEDDNKITSIKSDVDDIFKELL